jgi:hypothetical protein
MSPACEWEISIERDSGIGTEHSTTQSRRSRRRLAMLEDGVDSERRNDMNGIMRELTMKLREPAGEEASEETWRRSWG